jgi:hypothetical protein
LSARAILLVLALLLVAAPAARADGDPASDYLLGEPTFIPPDAGVPPAYAKQLTSILADAKARGKEIRVALIAKPYDLGSVGILFGKPKEYGLFLGQELTFVYRGRVLIVMPSGFGYSRDGKRVPAADAVLAQLPAPGKGGAALASAATQAVSRLTGVPVPPVEGGTSGPSQTAERVLIVAVTALVVAGIVAFRLLRRRRRA